MYDKILILSKSTHWLSYAELLLALKSKIAGRSTQYKSLDKLSHHLRLGVVPMSFLRGLLNYYEDSRLQTRSSTQKSRAAVRVDSDNTKADYLSTQMEELPAVELRRWAAILAAGCGWVAGDSMSVGAATTIHHGLAILEQEHHF